MLISCVINEQVDILNVHYRIQYGRSTGERPWLTIEDTVLEQTGALIGMYMNVLYSRA